MSNNDELLFGAQRVDARDSDGDGVSDEQERVDGTDPNDATDSIHPGPVDVDPSRDPSDPRGDLNDISLERETVLDLTGAIPAGHSLDQALPTGLDGNPVHSGPNHYGVGTDQLLDGRGDNPLGDISRDPTQGGVRPAAPGAGRDAAKDTLGRDSGPAVKGEASFGGNNYSTPPPGEAPSGSADPDHNPDLVSGKGDTPISDAVYKNAVKVGESIKDVSSIPGAVYQGLKEGILGKESGPIGRDEDYPVPPPPPAPPKDKTYDDPDAAGGTVVPTEEQIAHAVAAHGGATDVVQGYGGGPQIEGDAPPKRAGDLVTDPGDGDSADVSTSISTSTVMPPGQEISHTLNPDAGFGSDRGPSVGPGTGGGDDIAGFSSAATASEAPVAAPGDASGGISLVGSGSSGGGIQTIDGDVTGMGSAPSASGSGTVSQSSAMMAGDDDDLDELEVERVDMAAAGPGTQTEDEVNIGGLSAPVDAPPTAESPLGSDAAAPAADTASIGVVEVGQVLAPVQDQPVVEAAPVPLDPVADAMTTVDAVAFEAPAETFSGLDVNDDLAIPDEVDLDDGF